MREVFSPVVCGLGPSIEIETTRRGHYPRGGGEVRCEVKAAPCIEPMKQIEFGEIHEVRGISHCVRLPSHVASRQASSAKSTLEGAGITSVSITEESYPKGNDPHLGPGSGIVLWTEAENGMRIGADALGKRGKRAEDVGDEAGRQLAKEIATNRAVDAHLCDMLVPYLAMAKGESSIGITEVTSHLQTNIWVTEQILRVESHLEGSIGQPGILSVKGCGFTPNQR